MKWLILIFDVCFASRLILYEYASFEPVEISYLQKSIDSVYSSNDCICRCYAEPLCITGIYKSVQNNCTLLSCPFTKSLLKLVYDGGLNQVFTFVNKTLPKPALITSVNETAYGIWNTMAGSNGLLATVGFSVGCYPSYQSANTVFDRNNTTKYVAFGTCNSTHPPNMEYCGENTGLFLSLKRGSSLLLGFRFWAPNSFPEQDPMTITIEGSNKIQTDLILGRSWELLYNGSSGMEIVPARYNPGEFIWFQNNRRWYTSYRILVTRKRSVGLFVQYSELELYGY